MEKRFEEKKNINGEVVLSDTEVEVVKGEIISEPTTEMIEKKEKPKFMEVDFDNPSTMLIYGDEPKKAIAAILENTARLADDREELQVDKETLESLTTFGETLDESEEEKKKKYTPAIKGVRGFLTKLGVKRFEEQERKKSYKVQYEDYCSKIESICTAIESQKQTSLANIELRSCIVKEMTPYLDLLEKIIQEGKAKKFVFDNETESLRKLEPTKENLDLIGYREQLSEFFNGKLTELEKVLVAYRDQVQMYRVQQITDFEIVKGHETFLKDTSPILKAQGSVMVLNHQQKSELAEIKMVNDFANLAIANNSNQLVENAESAVELSLNNGISVETLTKLDDAIRRGVEIYVQGKEQKKAIVEETQQALQQLGASIDEYQNELLRLIDDEQVIRTLGTSSATTTISKRFIKGKGYGSKRS